SGGAAGGGAPSGAGAGGGARGPPRRRPGAGGPGGVLRELAQHRGMHEPEDDALVLCLDWHGRPGTS
ncbi:phosphatase, partial [Streptomyces sp. NPDC059506]